METNELLTETEQALSKSIAKRLLELRAITRQKKLDEETKQVQEESALMTRKDIADLLQ